MLRISVVPRLAGSCTAGWRRPSARTAMRPSYRAFTAATAPASSQEAVDPIQGETETLTIYESPRSTPITVVTRLAAMKSYVASLAVVHALYNQYTKFASPQQLYEVMMGFEPAGAPEVDLRMAGIFTIAAVVGKAVSSVLSNRTVTKIQVTMPKQHADALRVDTSPEACVEASPTDPWAERARRLDALAAASAGPHTAQHIVNISKPRIWAGNTVITTTRKDIVCAPPTTLTQCFQLRVASGRLVEQYLYPVKNWRTEALPYLKSMLYADYFIPDEKQPQPDVEKLFIEGFGAYRPAQFADPLHPEAPKIEQTAEKIAIETGNAQKAANGAISCSAGFGELLLPKTSGRVAIPNTPFFLEDAAVWAEFKKPQPLSREEMRLLEREAKLHGATKAKLDRLPTPAATVDVMLDGNRVDAKRLTFHTDVTASLPEPLEAKSTHTAAT